MDVIVFTISTAVAVLCSAFLVASCFLDRAKWKPSEKAQLVVDLLTLCPEEWDGSCLEDYVRHLPSGTYLSVYRRSGEIIYVRIHSSGIWHLFEDKRDQKFIAQAYDKWLKNPSGGDRIKDALVKAVAECRVHRENA